jgi:hypothetical protein
MAEGPIDRSPATASVRRLRRRVLTGFLLLFVAGCMAFVLTRHREIPLAEPFSDQTIVHKIVGALPSGWLVAKLEEDQLPSGQHWGDDYRTHWHGGEKLTLAGPTEIVVGSPPEAIKAVESLELWIMPSTYPDGSLEFALFAYQTAGEIYRDRKVAVYALTSRYDGHRNLDHYVSDVYQETSPLAPAKDGLAISWTSYKADISKALRN